VDVPELNLHQCGLPKKIAQEQIQPNDIRRLNAHGHAATIKSAKRMLERRDEDVWDILDDVIRNHPVLLNRAPTLHRIGIQAFEPILVEGNAIRLHPLVCKGFNADFDGDQMAVHLPLSMEAQIEATTLMMSTHNIFSPANGAPIISASQDIVMGCYYLTLKRPDRPGEGMVFASSEEVFMAFQLGKVSRHATIRLRMPRGKRVKGDGAETYRPGGLVETSPGRVIFNDILPKKMSYYNQTLGSKDLARVISDCYLELGRRETIELLDRMKSCGFRASTESGLSFGVSDLKTAPNKQEVIGKSEKDVLKQQKLFERGVITNQERYNKVLDIWTHAREEITKSMMEQLKEDVRESGAYVNPIYLMAHSGARGGVGQIQQLAGMRGLMAKPSGEIIETPIKSNFREGLSVLEYFSSTHGARKGLADTALKTADSGYLTRKLADVCQNMVITMHDCKTTKGLTRGVVYRGEKVEVGLADAIRGRVSRTNIVNLITEEPIVKEGELITVEKARKIEEMGLERIQVRSLMTCECTLGLCQQCYGMDLSMGDLVELGMAVGIIAAQSIGEPGTQLTMRTFHIGGVASKDVETSELFAKRGGQVRFTRIRSVINAEGGQVVLGRNGEISIVDDRGREVEKQRVPNGAVLQVRENQNVNSGDVLCTWDPHSIPIIAQVGGRARLDDCVEGQSIRTEKEQSGTMRRTVIEHKAGLHPQVVIEDGAGKILDFYYLPEGASLDVEDGGQISAGMVVAKTPRESTGTQDITGGLPRVTELFEVRKPKDPAVVAEIDGEVEFPPEKKRGKRIVLVKGADGTEVEHVIPHGKDLQVHPGDMVKAGDALVRGPLVPQDILRVSGPEEVQQYLLHEIQNVYRAQRVEIDDKHIEIVIAQMLRKVRVDSVGDTDLLPGLLIDKFELKKINDGLESMGKVTDAGGSDFEIGDRVLLTDITAVNAEVSKPIKHTTLKRAKASPQLLGITKAAVSSESFISAASFQETTKVLTEAALGGKVDNLVGLKENVILGHLIPAGTGFHLHQEAQVRIHDSALREQEEQKMRMAAARKDLMGNSELQARRVDPDRPSAPSLADLTPDELI
ncbi:MAG: DNA-directed RNA polymerase subunit beta', partial [Fuerstia sp.]|nr:DNA-directed RNA polymerase subunit beta' [Fuerstiella sp.]